MGLGFGGKWEGETICTDIDWEMVAFFIVVIVQSRRYLFFFFLWWFSGLVFKLRFCRGYHRGERLDREAETEHGECTDCSTCRGV